MLSLLHIENVAVIEQSDITFDCGFNVLTGETGAGKSIIIDAISAILGERTYRDVIRTGAQKAFVSAVFLRVPKLSWFEENAVVYEEELLIQRELYLDGKNICRVNGQPVTVSILRKLGLQLINIHGQHDSQQLFDEANHLRYLDLLAKDDDLLGDYQACYQTVLAMRKEIEHLSMDEAEKQRRLETLRYQISELEKADLHPGEDEELESRRKLLQNSEKLANGLDEAVASLYGDDSQDGAAALLSVAEHALSKISRYDDTIDGLYSRAMELYSQVQDLAEETRDFKDTLSYSENELEELESRLDQIHRLRRKYGNTCDDMLQYLEQARTQLDEIEFAGDRLLQLNKELSAAEQRAQTAGETLRVARKKAAVIMEQRVLSELAQLDMPKVQFACAFTALPLSPDGMDGVSFLMSANAGESLKPMNKVASGGELARIMLAMKNVLADQDHVETLIFDEVDAGVSGRAAQKVAEKLKRVSANKQVLCVTHLPQIAAMADHHLLISKEERKGRTYTSVTPLDFEGRKAEIARIIGGAVITETTLKSAEEMMRH